LARLKSVTAVVARSVDCSDLSRKNLDIFMGLTLPAALNSKSPATLSGSGALRTGLGVGGPFDAPAAKNEQSSGRLHCPGSKQKKATVILSGGEGLRVTGLRAKVVLNYHRVRGIDIP